jgi:hypothetical protein
MSAGLVTIAGTRELVSLPPSSSLTYGTFQSLDVLWAGGETLTFSATGADVPAFTDSIIAPAQMQITSATVMPPPSQVDDPIIDKSQDFTVTWAAPSFGMVEITMSDPVVEHQLRCKFEASAGTATIPSTSLMKLLANLGWFTIGTVGANHVFAGDWSVALRAYYAPTWPGGVVLSGHVRYQ